MDEYCPYAGLDSYLFLTLSPIPAQEGPGANTILVAGAIPFTSITFWLRPQLNGTTSSSLPSRIRGESSLQRNNWRAFPHVGQICSTDTKTYALDEVAEALKSQESGKAIGKVLVRIQNP
jgi:hypothetical protein